MLAAISSLQAVGAARKRLADGTLAALATVQRRSVASAAAEGDTITVEVRMAHGFDAPPPCQGGGAAAFAGAGPASRSDCGFRSSALAFPQLLTPARSLSH